MVKADMGQVPDIMPAGKRGLITDELCHDPEPPPAAQKAEQAVKDLAGMVKMLNDFGCHDKIVGF